MHDHAISSLRLRLGAMLILRQMVLFITAWAFAWGVVTLVTRVVSGGSPQWLLWGMLGAPLVIAFAVIRGLRQVPDERAVRALVDRASLCGGLLMAAAEQPLGNWSRRLGDAAALSVRWDARRGLAMFTVAAGFLAVTLLFPQRLAAWTDRPLEINENVVSLVSKIDLLKENGAIEKKRADFLTEKLKQLKEESSGRDPAKTLEALDHLRDQLKKAAEQATEAAIKKNENLGKAEALADAMKKNAGKLSDKVEKAALDELANLIKKAAEENAAAKDNDAAKALDAELAKALEDGQLTPEELEALAKALEGLQGGIEGFGDKLAKARLIDPDLLRRLIEAGEFDDLGDDLGECDGDCIGDLLVRCRCNGQRGGIGGLTRGPGHNPISWTKGTDEEGAKFKEMTLPPDRISSIKQSKVLAVGKTDPKTGEVTVSTGGALDRVNAGGGGANTGVLLPQHRGAVERYFHREEKK